MKYLNISKRVGLLISSFFLIQALFSQEGYLNHFQRKVDLEKIILVGEKYNDKLFRIPLPRDTYDKGKIVLKSPKLAGIKFKKAELEFGKDEFKVVRYYVSKRQKELLDKKLQGKEDGLVIDKRQLTGQFLYIITKSK